MAPEKSNLGRRNFLQMTGAGIVAASAGATATQALVSDQPADSEVSGGIVAQPSPLPASLACASAPPALAPYTF
jgi:hypothetical protein